MRCCVELFFILMSICPLVSAWGPEGHRTIATVAKSRLTPAAKLHIRELLGSDDLAEISNWADEIRHDRPETFGWHFVDIPMNATGFYEPRDCYRPERKYPYTFQDHHNCVVDRVTIFGQVLADPSSTRADRIDALKFLVHFVGDIHQPMHAIGEARGGNDIHVVPLDSYDCSDRSCNLHALWDFGLIVHHMNFGQPPFAPADYPTIINAVIVRDHLQIRAGGTPEQWANESFQLARQAWLKDGDRVDDLYYGKNIRILEDQLGLASIRLAETLNEIFRRNLSGNEPAVKHEVNQHACH
jgi:hypothetical protein